MADNKIIELAKEIVSIVDSEYRVFDLTVRSRTINGKDYKQEIDQVLPLYLSAIQLLDEQKDEYLTPSQEIPCRETTKEEHIERLLWMIKETLPRLRRKKEKYLKEEGGAVEIRFGFVVEPGQYWLYTHDSITSLLKEEGISHEIDKSGEEERLSIWF